MQDSHRTHPKTILAIGISIVIINICSTDIFNCWDNDEGFFDVNSVMLYCQVATFVFVTLVSTQLETWIDE